MAKILVTLSGGLDTAALLHIAVKQNAANPVAAVHFSYGNRNDVFETRACQELTKFYAIQLYNVELTGVFRFCPSSLLGHGPPQIAGHHHSPSMSSNTVPNRNTVFATAASSIAESLDFTEVWLGTHAGAFDRDSSELWLNPLRRTIEIGSNNKIDLRAPFINLTKKDIIELALAEGVPLQHTRSCYSGGYPACGLCGACQSRLHTFAELGKEDPIEYKTRKLISL